MKKLGMALLVLASIGFARQTQATQNTSPQPQGLQRVANLDVGNAPTPNDMYCSGFISSEKIPDKLFVAAGANSPDQVRYAGSTDTIFIRGQGMKAGERYQILRHAKDPNDYELFRGQRAAIRYAGWPYFELGYVKVVDVQRDVAIAVPELSCIDFVPGDIAIPFVERETPVFRKVSLDSFAAPNGKTVGRILMAKEFDSSLGSKYKVYLNIGSDKGLKPGDYLRATRTYAYTYHDREAGLSLKASDNEDTQARPQKLPKGDISVLPRHTLGDMIVLQVHHRSATAMILTALQDIHVGDGVELMDVSDAPPMAPIKPTAPSDSSTSPTTAPGPAATAALPTITCTATPGSVRAGESATINCNAASPDNRPLSITYVTNGGKLSSSKNQATLDTTGAGPGPIQVRATVFDDQQLSAAAVTTVNVEAPPPPLPTAQQLTSLDFKPMSAYVDNRSKAVLDDIALKLQQDPTSTAVLSGSSDEKEPPRLATQRAENAKTYLTKSKGIDPQRIQVRAGSEPGHKVDVLTVPAGATMPTPQPK